MNEFFRMILFISYTSTTLCVRFCCQVCCFCTAIAPAYQRFHPPKYFGRGEKSFLHENDVFLPIQNKIFHCKRANPFIFLVELCNHTWWGWSCSRTLNCSHEVLLNAWMTVPCLAWLDIVLCHIRYGGPWKGSCIFVNRPQIQYAFMCCGISHTATSPSEDEHPLMTKAWVLDMLQPDKIHCAAYPPHMYADWETQFATPGEEGGGGIHQGPKKLMPHAHATPIALISLTTAVGPLCLLWVWGCPRVRHIWMHAHAVHHHMARTMHILAHSLQPCSPAPHLHWFDGT